MNLTSPLRHTVSTRPATLAAVALRCQLAALMLLRDHVRSAPRPRRQDRRLDRGFVSVESIGWIGIAVVVVAVVGLIVRSKLVAMANSLPDTLGW